MNRFFRHRKLKKLDATQAKEQFESLIEELSRHGGGIEITDSERGSVVMLSYRDYLWLRSQASTADATKRPLVGSIEIVTDLEAASEQISAVMLQSIERSFRELDAD